MQDLPNGGGGGGAAPSIGPRALETLATPLVQRPGRPYTGSGGRTSMVVGSGRVVDGGGWEGLRHVPVAYYLLHVDYYSQERCCISGHLSKRLLGVTFGYTHPSNSCTNRFIIR